MSLRTIETEIGRSLLEQLADQFLTASGMIFDDEDIHQVKLELPENIPVKITFDKHKEVKYVDLNENKEARES